MGKQNNNSCYTMRREMVLVFLCWLLPLSSNLVSGLVEGEDSEEGKHPWHVGLVREESKTGVVGWLTHLGGLIRTTTFCGASLVGQRWLVTAAHCIKDRDRVGGLRVVMGNSKRAKFFYYFFQTDSIDQIHIHPRYDNSSHAYDIAILRLKEIGGPKMCFRSDGASCHG